MYIKSIGLAVQTGRGQVLADIIVQGRGTIMSYHRSKADHNSANSKEIRKSWLLQYGILSVGSCQGQDAQ